MTDEQRTNQSHTKPAHQRALIIRLALAMLLAAAALAMTSTTPTVSAATSAAAANPEAIGTGLADTIATIEASLGHSCNVLNDGSVACWGDNGEGQLGNGTTTDSNTPVAVNLPAGTTATAITSDGNHTCAILNDGTATCWGNNSNGQLGKGTTTDSSLPVAVSLPAATTATAITAGRNHACAILSNGSISCWGNNGNGQLGDGSTTQSLVPVTVSLPAGTTATAVDAGSSYTCAILNDGTATCWGNNTVGQLGNGTTTESLVPVTVNLPAGTTATAITATFSHTCAILNDGTATCWGSNNNGQLGNNDTTNSSTPVTVDLPTGSTATTISAGSGFTCAVLNTGAATCWGGNGLGQLGNGNNDDTNSPVTVSLPTGSTAISISAGSSHTCALLNDGAATCWGSNNNGQLGTGANDTTNVPVAVAASALLASNPATAVSAGSGFSCVLLDDGTIACWGSNFFGQLGNGSNTSSTAPATVNLPAGATATTITSAGNYNCAILNDGRVTCWGNNSTGMLGDGTTTNSNTPVSVNLPVGTTAIAITAGGSHSCALLDDGTAACWGSNTFGQLGDGSTTNSNTPVSVNLPVGTTAVAITASSSHSCALLNTGAVSCWGFNNQGQLGDGTNDDSLAPVAVDLPAGTTATAMAGGTRHTCAILNTGATTCWGNNNNGQLGNGTTTRSNTPVSVGLPVDTTALALTTQDDTNCVLLNDGSTRCWGFNNQGQLGDGSTGASSSPVTVDLSGFPDHTPIAITAGTFRTCALLNDATVICWGGSTGRPLENGVATDSLIPVVAGVPGAPTPATATATSMQAQLSWTPAPESAFGPVTAWAIEQSTDNGTTWTPATVPTPPAAGDTTTTITALTDNTTYVFRVAGINTAGTSTYAVTNPVTPTTPLTATIDYAPGQTDPTETLPVAFQITFNNPPVNFTATNLTLGGTAAATGITLIGTGTIYTATITDVTNAGTITIDLPNGTVNDAAGNPNTTTLTTNTITLDDNTGPVIDVPAGGIQANTDPGQPGATITYTVTATDPDPNPTPPVGVANLTAAQLGADPTVDCTPASGSFFPIGATTVDCSATDEAGNTSTANFAVTVTDNEDPVIDGTNQSFDLAPGATNGTFDYTEPTATDNSGTATITCTPPPGATFTTGDNTITCIATDPTGNTTTNAFTITANATPTPTTAPAPTPTTPAPSPTTPSPTTPAPTPTVPPNGLPATGSNPDILLLLALALLAFGALTTATTRRRQRQG